MAHLLDDWTKHGPRVPATVRDQEPSTYLRVAFSFAKAGIPSQGIAVIVVLAQLLPLSPAPVSSALQQTRASPL
jgi:hypothetical protein